MFCIGLGRKLLTILHFNNFQPVELLTDITTTQQGARVPVLIQCFKGDIEGVYGSSRLSLRPTKLFNLISFDSFWVRGALGNVVTSIV